MTPRQNVQTHLRNVLLVGAATTQNACHPVHPGYAVVDMLPEPACRATPYVPAVVEPAGEGFRVQVGPLPAGFFWVAPPEVPEGSILAEDGIWRILLPAGSPGTRLPIRCPAGSGGLFVLVSPGPPPTVQIQDE